MGSEDSAWARGGAHKDQQLPGLYSARGGRPDCQGRSGSVRRPGVHVGDPLRRVNLAAWTDGHWMDVRRPEGPRERLTPLWASVSHPHSSEDLGVRSAVAQDAASSSWTTRWRLAPAGRRSARGSAPHVPKAETSGTVAAMWSRGQAACMVGLEEVGQGPHLADLAPAWPLTGRCQF